MITFYTIKETQERASKYPGKTPDEKLVHYLRDMDKQQMEKRGYPDWKSSDPCPCGKKCDY